MTRDEAAELYSELFETYDVQWPEYGRPSLEDIKLVLDALEGRLDSSGADTIELSSIAVRKTDSGYAYYFNLG